MSPKLRLVRCCWQQDSASALARYGAGRESAIEWIRTKQSCTHSGPLSFVPATLLAPILACLLASKHSTVRPASRSTLAV